ncbi:MAG: hypothetical protein HKM93_12030 [Desulfobacteraceae bacterium]|nr:hypothetical protein [Desulfobacteraceae bacterium]
MDRKTDGNGGIQTPFTISSPPDTPCCRNRGLENIPAHHSTTESVQIISDSAPCCGPAPPPPSTPHERPGYRICGYVSGFHHTAVGDVPEIHTRTSMVDKLGSAMVRAGIGRGVYRVAPGLYCAGKPDGDSPVLVTANYKLTFDILRRQLTGITAWLLVLDTRGVNVWCAAGKKTFSTEEVIRRVRDARLDQLIRHRQLILPQLGATGVSARVVKQAVGFEVIWGPVRSHDIPDFLDRDMKSDPGMRRVTFSFTERLVLIPVEIRLLFKTFLWSIPIAFLLSGIGPHIFSFRAAWFRGQWALMGFLAGVVAGTILVPALLPWLPGRAFALKGGIAAGIAGILVGIVGIPELGMVAVISLMLLALSVGSYYGMNFTGSTPFTSPTGVEKEMRVAVPVQAVTLALAIILWVATPFLG